MSCYPRCPLNFQYLRLKTRDLCLIMACLTLCRRKGRGRSLSSTHSKDAPQATTRSQRRTRLYLRGSGRGHDVEQEEPEDADPDDISSDEEIQSPPSMYHDLSSKTPPPSCDKVCWCSCKLPVLKTIFSLFSAACYFFIS